MQGQPRRAAVLLYEGCTIVEVIEIATRLADQGVQVEFVASATGELRDLAGLRMLPDRSIAEVDSAGLTVVVVPGGNPDSVIDDQAVLDWLRRADEANVLIAAICAGVAIVASAGIVAGHHITHNYRHPWASSEVIAYVDHLWAGAAIEPDRTVGVVRDRNLITALPNAPVAFAMEILVALGLYDRRRAELVGDHLRGGYVEQLYDAR